MCDCELRKTILESGLYSRYAKARRNSYLQSKGESFEGETLIGFEMFLAEEHTENWYQIVNECERIGNTSYQRIKRLKTRIKRLLDKSECLFLTLTFSPSTMAKTSANDRRKIVIDYLNSTKCEYIGNIDFGKQNEREHYHAVVCCDKVDYTLWHNYGAVKGQKVKIRGKTESKLARYIDKLALHSIKDTTQKHRLLYSMSKNAI